MKKKLQETKCYELSFVKNKVLFLKCVFMFPPGIVDRSEFTSKYSLQLSIVTCLYASMEKHALSHMIIYNLNS